jgi:cell wall-associated NlpC family hydrolase
MSGLALTGSALRSAVVACCRMAQGADYIFGAEGHEEHGYDCSGLPQRAWWCCGIGTWLRPTRLTADGLWRTLAPVPEGEHVYPGDLAFYGTPERASHVVVVTGIGPGGEVTEVIGASGGNSQIDTTAEARAAHARVRTFPSHQYGRPGFLGFRRMPGE